MPGTAGVPDSLAGASVLLPYQATPCAAWALEGFGHEHAAVQQKSYRQRAGPASNHICLQFLAYP